MDNDEGLYQRDAIFFFNYFVIKVSYVRFNFVIYSRTKNYISKIKEGGRDVIWVYRVKWYIWLEVLDIEGILHVDGKPLKAIRKICP